MNGITLTLTSQPGLFSPRHVDAGTLAMLQSVQFEPHDRVLDLGCGCGVVGLYAAKHIGESRVVMVDIDPLAVQVAGKNAAANHLPGLTIKQSDGFHDFDGTDFTKILCNPPYHTDFSVARHFILKGFNRLSIGGEMVLVTKRDTWYRKKMTSVFGGHQCQSVNGYFVIRATRRQSGYARRR